jgi:spermidine synthase
MKETDISSRSVLLLAFTEGAAVMALELLGGRMIAPVFGSSLFVWTTVLGITMLGLALGYHFGGRIANSVNIATKLLLFFIVSAFFFLIIPGIAGFLVPALNSDHFLLSIFISALTFLFLPLMVLGSTTPVLVKLYNTSKAGQGKASGHIYGTSTIGGIVFTFVIGFWLMPEYGLSVSSAIIGIMLSIMPSVILSRKKSKAWLLLPVLVFLGGVIFYSPDNEIEGVKVIHQSEGLLGQLLVVDQNNNGRSERILFVNRMGQTWIEKETGNSLWTYPNYLAVLGSGIKEKPEVLILGIGGGTVGNLLKNTLNANVEAVELDSRIAEIARKNFNLDRSIKITIDDARHFIKTSEKKFDLILFDVFKGEVPPSHVLTRECFTEVKKNLNKGGIMVVNFNGFLEGSKGRAGRAIIKTILDAGYQLQIFPTYGADKDRNILYVASLDSVSFKETRIHLNLFNKEVSIDSMKIPLAGVKFDDKDKGLTDDFPVLELLNLEAAQEWRKSYNDNFTKKYIDKGIPIFK